MACWPGLCSAHGVWRAAIPGRKVVLILFRNDTLLQESASMEMQRRLVLVGMFVVAYLLFWNWQKEHVSPSSAPSPVAAAATPAAQGADIPQVATPAATTAAMPHDSTAKNLILARSDVLTLSIDPQGGDITSLGLLQYPQRQGGARPFSLFEDDRARTFIAQSGLIGPDGPDAAAQRPVYSSAQSVWTMPAGQDQMDVVLHDETPTAVIDKIYHLQRGSYVIKIDYQVHNKTAKAWNANLFAQFKRDDSADPSTQSGIRISSFLGAAYWTADKPYNKIALKDLQKDALQLKEQGGWLALVQHYFVSAWIADPGARTSYSTRSQDGMNYLSMIAAPFSVAPGQTAQSSVRLYAGPKIQRNLSVLSPGLDLTVDYGWLWPIAEALFWLLVHIHQFIGNWGWSIVFLTIIVKAAFWPLSAASYRSMAQMRKIAPEMQRMREQYGEDRQKLSQAMMEFYRKEKINPLGGCLPMLVQMPVFIALYWTLMESVQLRHAPFIFWIHDLADMDHLFILPLVMGVTMYVQQHLNPAPADPTQAKMMKLMPVIFTGFFLFFPAGLVLYWVVSNLVSIAQQWYVTQRLQAQS